MFLDEKVLTVTAGKGGDGAVLFRREKYVPYGGPDGGDGGKGGDVIIQAVHNLHALNHLSSVDRIDAESGQNGATQKKTGRSGEDVTILVPVGTECWHEPKAEEPFVVLDTDGKSVVLAKGGNGGWGNWHFKSSRQQAPDRANPGLPGESLKIHLVLKLIADVGLIGLPNAGKSTFLASCTAATPKIANYPFTTLEPQLGVAQVGKSGDGVTLVIADLPGLIEGASGGKGLGSTFLKHVERTKSLLHLIDATQSTEEICAAYTTIRTELKQWSEVLAVKKEVVALTKIEVLLPEELAEKKAAIEAVVGTDVFTISAIARTGVAELLYALA